MDMEQRVGNRGYDVIIVGGGPAGSTAGYLLGKYGLKVLIIDKSNFPREKPCAGCITYKTVKLLERIFDIRIKDLKEKGIVNFESNQYEVFYKDKSIIKGTSNFPFYFLDRKAYDALLLKKAQDQGVEIIEGERVISLDLSKGIVITSTERSLKARFIIGADGVNSIIRRSLPKGQVNQNLWQYNLATALEITIDRSEVDNEINHPVLFFGFINWGYCWMFPNRERVRFGICGLNRENKRLFLNSFYDFLSAVHLKKKIEISAHPLPYGNFLLRPVYRNVILVGDAAGFADPLFGEGIFYAQRSAEFASEAIYKNRSGNKTLELTYLELLQRYIYLEFIYAQRIRWLIFKIFNRFACYPLKILSNILGRKTGETVQGFRSYRWLRKKTGDLIFTGKKMNRVI